MTSREEDACRYNSGTSGFADIYLGTTFAEDKFMRNKPNRVAKYSRTAETRKKTPVHTPSPPEENAVPP